MRLLNLQMLHLLWLLPLLAGFYLYAARRRRRALAVFIAQGLLPRIRMTVSPVRRRWKAILVLAAAFMVVAALTRPGWNPRVETIRQRGRDVVFLLDVSRSMLAEDLAPNRLERAKLAIGDCVERLKGDRVALVAFAGSAVVKCPLTLDYGFFRMTLQDISAESVARGGTLIGDALRKVLVDVFDDQVRQFKDVVLITDGEDQESFPLEAAREAGERGVRLIAIGLGDEKEGRRIPVADADGRTRFLTHQGREVWSRLDAGTLRRMAGATPGGRYLNVATGTFDLGEIYLRLIADAEKKAHSSESVKRYEEKFQIFIACALLLLVAEMLLGDGIPVRENRR